ncbi:ABC transporter ATP-binding protein [Leucobacter tenebrionis]|uniref:ABC transporter ATP-binding protein n=1 Tax=Leucobacter tenebrionis TaxID=2873270 RepID=UPI001CA659E2|nr:ABC transporter ATP-binding protein [Leucobacter tenebrionis]QZY52729.1 ABC transporter ATP-binding protein [Leucobacter tenebrionis]
MSGQDRTRAPKLRIGGLVKRFGAGGSAVTALEGVDLEVAENEFVSIVGASGCGKSTLLSLVAGLEEPTEGTIEVGGREVVGPGRDRGVVFQQATLMPWLTVQQNVEFALRGEPGLTRSERADRAREFLRLVGLEGFERSYPAQLSGGMQQRVALARSLSYGPDMLLMDEPFGALDALTRRTMQELLLEVWEQHRLTVLLVTHDIDEAVVTSDRVVVMSPRPGRVQRIVDVPIPRPRTLASERTPEFQGLSDEILALIRVHPAAE